MGSAGVRAAERGWRGEACWGSRLAMGAVGGVEAAGAGLTACALPVPQAALKKYQAEQRSRGDALDKCQAELRKLRKKSQGSKNPQKYSDKELQVGCRRRAGRAQGACSRSPGHPPPAARLALCGRGGGAPVRSQGSPGGSPSMESGRAGPRSS